MLDRPIAATPRTAGIAGGAHVPLARLTRGVAVESIHYGSVAVVDRDGRLLAAAGDPAFVTMTRSALKPFQAMPFVAAGGPERFGYSKPQVALLCASHSGEPRHVDAVADMLARAGQLARRSSLRNARARVFRGARRSAAASAVLAACAQLLGQAQRHARVLRPVRASARQLSRRSASAAAGDPARRRALHRDARGGARRRHRRLLGAELRRRARAPRAGVRAPRRRRRRRRVRQCAARARRRDDRAPGDGVGRAPLRSRVEPGRAAETGSARSARKVSRRSGSAAPAWGSRSRSSTATAVCCGRSSHRCSSSWGCWTPGGALRSRIGSSRPCATIAVS